MILERSIRLVTGCVSLRRNRRYFQVLADNFGSAEQMPAISSIRHCRGRILQHMRLGQTCCILASTTLYSELQK